MSASRDDRTAQDWLQQALTTLPDAEPPPLFERIMRSRVRRRRQRRLVVAAALGALGALGAVLAPLSPVPDALPREAMHAELRPGTEVALLLLDRQLQAAYDRGASETELAELWQARAQLLFANTNPVQHQETHHASILAL